MVVDLLDINESAAALRVSKMTVYRLIHADQLAAVRVGNSFRVRRRDLVAFLAAACRPALSGVAGPGPDESVSSPSGI